MGGSPLQTVERIKNMVYLNHTNEMGDDNRVEHLGENTLGHTHKTGFAKTPKQQQKPNAEGVESRGGGTRFLPFLPHRQPYVCSYPTV